MGEKGEWFEGLGWEEEIVSLAEPHVSYNPSPERLRSERSAVQRYREDFVMTPYSQSTQVWKCRLEEEERERNSKRARMPKDVREKQPVSRVESEDEDVVDLTADKEPWKANASDGEDNTKKAEDGVKDGEASSRTLSFRERVRRLSPHRLPLKERMKDPTIGYMDLLRPDPPREANEYKPRPSRITGRRLSPVRDSRGRR